jgi:prepilin-type N-terminal cleavage/methylation domain-containing protein
MKNSLRFSSAASSLAAFSLVELLVVVAILGVLAALAAGVLPAKSGAQVGQAGDTVSTLATLARQHAISKNALTVLVIADVNSGGTFRSIASIWDAGTTNQLEKWNLLPEGVLATNTSTFPPDVFAGAKFRGQTLTNTSAYWFYPDGRMGNDPTRVPQLSVRPRQGGANSYQLVFNPVIGTHKSERP